ncbi:unnamed protein product [Heterotrigona itama]|uniref:Uncharacterized protein n=1 Tax=Heterotrigona itama TaxID=395501 RepID=A0A6V7HDN0_9HYME|nr:unnamed protein product [Heterotrigona itama]
MKFGFLMRFTQNLSGSELLFHVCTTSGSDMPCCSAWSSMKSNMYLIARGRADPRWAVLKIVSNRSSTNFCRVPFVASSLVRSIRITNFTIGLKSMDCLISFSSDSEYLASDVMASTGPLSTCCFTARNSTYNGSPAHSRMNLYRRKVNQADNIFSATLSVLKYKTDCIVIQ